MASGRESRSWPDPGQALVLVAFAFCANHFGPATPALAAAPVLQSAQVYKPVRPPEAGGAVPTVGDGSRPVYQPSRPPQPGERVEIIEAKPPAPQPTEQAAAEAVAAPTATRAAPTIRRRGPTRHPWFWDQVPSTIAERAGFNLEATLNVVRQRRLTEGAMTTPTEARNLANTYGTEVALAARRHNVSEALILAVIAIESAGKQRARSPKGAQGLMQLMPATGRRFNVGDPYDVQSNINAGTAYLNWLLNEFGNDPVLALAGYNAGEGAVGKYRGVPPFRETRDYVVRVLDAYLSARTLCAGSQMSPRAPCRITP